MAKKQKKAKKKIVKKSKPRRASAAKPGMSAKNLEMFRKKLEEMREDLVRMVQKTKEDVQPEPEVGDEADVAVRSLARDLVFELSGNERHILEEVEAALRRIEKGTFGLCEATGKKISLARLKVIPYARYCIEYQNRFEKR